MVVDEKLHYKGYLEPDIPYANRKDHIYRFNKLVDWWNRPMGRILLIFVLAGFAAIIVWIEFHDMNEEPKIMFGFYLYVLVLHLILLGSLVPGEYHSKVFRVRIRRNGILMPNWSLFAIKRRNGKWIPIHMIKKLYPEYFDEKLIGFEIELMNGKKLSRTYHRSYLDDVQNIIQRTVEELRMRFPDQFWEHEFYKDGIPENPEDW
jgi:hypothetical protein